MTSVAQNYPQNFKQKHRYLRKSSNDLDMVIERRENSNNTTISNNNNINRIIKQAMNTSNNKHHSFNSLKQSQNQSQKRTQNQNGSRDVSPMIMRNTTKINSQFNKNANGSQMMSKSQIYPKIHNSQISAQNKNSQQNYLLKSSNNLQSKQNKGQQSHMRSEEYKKKLSHCKKLVHQIEYQVFSNSRVKILKMCRICNIEIDNPNICAYCTIFFCNNCQFYCQQIQEQCPVRCEFYQKQEQLDEAKQKVLNNNNSKKNSRNKDSKNSQHTQPDSYQNLESQDLKKEVSAQAKKIKKRIGNRKLVAHKYKEFISKQKQTQLIFSSLQNIGDSQSEDECDDQQQQLKQGEQCVATQNKKLQKQIRKNSVQFDSEGDLDDHLDIESKESIMLNEDDSQAMQENDKIVIQLHSLGEILKNKDLSFQPKKKSSRNEEKEKQSLIQLMEDPQYNINLQFIREQIYEESQSNCYQVNGSYQESQKFLKEKISQQRKNTQGCCKIACSIF